MRAGFSDRKSIPDLNSTNVFIGSPKFRQNIGCCNECAINSNNMWLIVTEKDMVKLKATFKMIEFEK